MSTPTWNGKRHHELTEHDWHVLRDRNHALWCRMLEASEGCEEKPEAKPKPAAPVVRYTTIKEVEEVARAFARGYGKALLKGIAKCTKEMVAEDRERIAALEKTVSEQAKVIENLRRYAIVVPVPAHLSLPGEPAS